MPHALSSLINLVHKWRAWWLQPILDRIISHQQQQQAHAIQDLKCQLYQQIQADAHEKWVNLNQILLATYQPPKTCLGLRYQPPQTLAEAMELLSKLAPIFDGYLKRSDSYNLLPLLVYHYQALWSSIARSVVTASGVSLEHVDFATLGMNGLLEAIACFTQGIVEQEIPNHYLAYVGGLDERAILALFRDLNQGNYRVDPSNPWPDLLGMALQYSALQYYQDDLFLQEKEALQASIFQALQQIMEDGDGTTTTD